MSKFTDEELRFTLHDAAPLPEGTVITGSVQGYAKFGPSDLARWQSCPGARAYGWARPMTEREFDAQYEQAWASEPEPPAKCECHENMGNDFYFLPHDACLRRDGKCTKGPNKGF